MQAVGGGGQNFNAQLQRGGAKFECAILEGGANFERERFSEFHRPPAINNDHSLIAVGPFLLRDRQFLFFM